MIPINNETIETIYSKTEPFIEDIKEQENKYYIEYKKRADERDKKYKEYRKLVEPFTKQQCMLREKEMVRLYVESFKLKNYILKAKLNGHTVTTNLYEEWPSPYCGKNSIDLVDKFGSKQYHKEYDKLDSEISKIRKEILE